MRKAYDLRTKETRPPLWIKRTLSRAEAWRRYTWPAQFLDRAKAREDGPLTAI